MTHPCQSRFSFLSRQPGWLLSLLAVVVVSTGLANIAHSSDRPNILWLTVEDMGCHLGCYGDQLARTPAIDRFARESIRFTRAYAESPMCAPSRSTIITGMHTGHLGTSPMRSQHPIPRFVRPFPAWLREAGYYCCNNVKTDYNVAAEQSMIAAAWDHSSNTAHWRGRPADRPFFAVHNYMDTHQSRASRDDYASFQTLVQSRLSQEEICDPSTVTLPPFYPDTAAARRTVARYYDCITALDHFFEEQLAELENAGLADDTIVFFFSDHGAGLPASKAAPLHQGLRVPMMVRFPPKYQHLAPLPPGSDCERIVSFVDLSVTVLNLAGVPIPSHLQGKPFLGKDLAEGSRFAYGSRDRMDETQEVTRWITDGRYHLVRSYDTRPALDQQSLTSFYNGNGELCQEIRRLYQESRLSDAQRHFWGESRPPLLFFDVEQDPYCQHDLAKDPAFAADVERLNKGLEAAMDRDIDLGFLPEPDRADLEAGQSAYERVRETDAYPYRRIVEVARHVGTGERGREIFEKAVRDTNAVVRYWGVVGLAALKEESMNSHSVWQSSCDDPSPAVRLVALETVARYGSEQASASALRRLAEELESSNGWAACRAARSLELLGEPARPFLGAMRQALERRSSGFAGPVGTNPVNPSLEFSLRTAIARLESNNL